MLQIIGGRFFNGNDIEERESDQPLRKFVVDRAHLVPDTICAMRELKPGPSTNDKFRALIDAAEFFDSDLTQVDSRDDNGGLLAIAVYAKGAYAIALVRFLNMLRESS